jgi:hypothetical protein
VLGVALRRVGDIGLHDLAAIGRLRGQDGLPYPFGHTHPLEQRQERISSVADRLDHGDLSAFREWTDTYAAAEIWVACRVHHRSTDTPYRRILAYRAGEAGYLAHQSSNDVVEVFALGPADLGTAIAGSVGLTEPGTRPRIIVPGYVGYFAQPATDYDDTDDDTDYFVRIADDRSSRPTEAVVRDDEVTAIAIIQSRWQPARRWGVDWTENLVAAIQIEADGDYVYSPDFSHAVPVTAQSLKERIDRIIAEDLSAQYHQRRNEP